jgi:hypothetical protein
MKCIYIADEGPGNSEQSLILSIFFLWLDSPIWTWASSFRRDFTISLIRHITLGRTPLESDQHVAETST